MARSLRRLGLFARLIVFSTSEGQVRPTAHPTTALGLLPGPGQRHRHVDGHCGIGASRDHGSVGNWRYGSPVRCHAHPERTRAAVRIRLVRRRGRQGPDLSVGTQSDTGGRARALEWHWGRGTMFLELFAPSLVGDKRYEDWFAKLERLSLSPGAAVALVRMLFEMDVTDILSVIRVPTLVLHKQDDKVVPVDEGRRIAELVPGAKFVELPGSDHWPWIGHELPVEEIQEFLTGVRDNTEPDPALVTVMFVDIADSTKRAAELGDRRWTDSSRATRSRPPDLNRYGGREVDTAGDGLFAIFDGPVRAIRCATALTEAVATVGLHIRTGIHTGECERIGDMCVVSPWSSGHVGALAGQGKSSSRAPCRTSSSVPA